MRSLLVRSRKQENVTLATMPVIRIGTKTICPFPICRLAEGWGSGYNESVMFCFLINLYRIGDINDIKTTKLYLKSRLYYGGLCTSHLYPPPHTHTHTNGEWRGQQLFIHYSLGPAERHSPALYDNKFNRIYMHNITSPAAGELKRPMSRTLAPLSPAHPRRCVCWGERGGGRRSVVTNDWCITNQAA